MGHAADGADLGHARHGVDLGADVVFLQGPAAARRQVAALDGVPEDLADGRGVGGQVGHDPFGQEGAGQGQPLQHALAGEVEVDVVLEDDGDHREVELRGRAHGLDAGQPLELERQRVGDLVLDLPRAAAHPVGEDDDLVLAQVGDGVHRRVERRRRPPTRVRAAARIMTRKRLRIEYSISFSIMVKFLTCLRGAKLFPVNGGERTTEANPKHQRDPIPLR